MKISSIYKIKKKQPELDFVDIDINKDIPLFIDPHFLACRTDAWSQKATKSIRSFFQHLLHLLSEKEYDEARLFFSHLTEPNETCLGLSKGSPKGRSVNKEDIKEIFDNLIKSNALKSGLVEDLEDSLIFVDGVGRDKLSDMTTNIIRNHLITYTQDQAKLWGFPLQSGAQSGFIWDVESLTWKSLYTDVLVVKGRRILLVPKGIVSYCDDYTPEKYHRHFVLNFLQNEHMRLRTSLITRKYRKDGSYSEHVYKKDLIDQVSDGSKEDLRDFTKKHPQVFQKFKEMRRKPKTSLTDTEINEGISLGEIAGYLVSELESLPLGKAAASQYEHSIAGILELLFYPDLICPQKQVQIHDGRKRIDITFDNAAQSGSFFDFHKVHGIPCQYIMVECKNYSSDPSNPELDQLIGRFSPNRGKVGILVCRSIENMDKFISRCNDAYKDSHGLIIPLTDSDLIYGLKERQKGFLSPLNDLLRTRGRLVQTN